MKRMKQFNQNKILKINVSFFFLVRLYIPLLVRLIHDDALNLNDYLEDFLQHLLENRLILVCLKINNMRFVKGHKSHV